MAGIFEGAFASFENGQIPNPTRLRMSFFLLLFIFSGIRLTLFSFIVSALNLSAARLLVNKGHVELSEPSGSECRVHGDIQKGKLISFKDAFRFLIFVSPTCFTFRRRKTQVVGRCRAIFADLFLFFF